LQKIKFETLSYAHEIILFISLSIFLFPFSLQATELVKVIGNTSGSNDYRYGPYYRSSSSSTSDYSRYAYLYNKSELNIPAGSIITKIEWLKQNSNTITGSNNFFEIQLKNSSSTALTNNETWGNLIVGSSTVYTSNSQNFTASANTYQSFSLSSTFVYNGESLVILTDHIKNGTANGSNNFYVQSASGKALGVASSSSLNNSSTLSTSLGNSRPTIRITYSNPLLINFNNQSASTGWNNLEGFVYDQIGRQFTWEKGGKVWIVDTNGVKLANPLINISDEVGDWRDHGMNGFALDPNFNTNGYFYMCYTVDRHHLKFFGTPTYNSSTDDYFSATIVRVTRYQADAATNFTTTLPNSRFVLIGESAATGIPCLHESHTGSSIVFGKDNTLMVSTGDGASYSTTDVGSANGTYFQVALTDSIIRPQENVGAFRSQMVNSFNGKVLRIDPMTGNGVASNPFYDSSNPRSAKSRTWCLGLRNPFRMTIDTSSGSANPIQANPGTLYIGDVGWASWEDLHVVSEGGKNLGWPLFEGLTQHGNYTNSNTQNLDAPNPLFGIGGCTQEYFTFNQLCKQATLVHPIVFSNPCDVSVTIPASIPTFVHDRPQVDWSHMSSTNARTGIYNGTSAAQISINDPTSPVKGVLFNGSASVGGVKYFGSNFPSPYNEMYFQADYVGGWIKGMKLDANGNPTEVLPFAEELGPVVYLTVNPNDGCLHYVKFPAEIRKICYSINVNKLPIAKISADTIYGASPLTVNFSSSQSYDPDGGPLTYLWTFANGQTSTSANPTFTFIDSSGVPTVQWVYLTVTDDSLATAIDSIQIYLNNTPPQVSITSFQNGDLYSISAPTILPLEALVIDLEHGPSDLFYQWTTIFHHNTHTHPEPMDTAKSTSTLLSPIGCDENYYYEIQLIVSDALGLSTTVNQFLYPACSVPVADFNWNDTAICKKELVTFSDESTMLPSTRIWTFQNGNPSSSSLKNPIIKFNSPGLKQVKLIVSNPIGSDTIIKFVEVNNLPNGTVTSHNISVFCDGDSVLLTANQNPNLTYQWKRNNDPIIGATSFEYYADQTGVYKVEVTNHKTCSRHSNWVRIDKLSLPPAQITFTGGLNLCNGDSVIFSANIDSLYTYQWSEHFIPMLNDTNPNLTIYNPGVYRVLVTDTNGCSRYSGGKTVTSNCRLMAKDESENWTLEAMPNPFNEQLNISYDTQTSSYIQLIVFDALGRKVFEEKIEGDKKGVLSIDSYKWNSGLYFVNVISTSFNKSVKILKQ